MLSLELRKLTIEIIRQCLCLSFGLAGHHHDPAVFLDLDARLIVPSRRPKILWPQELVAPLRTYLNIRRPLLSAIKRHSVKPAGDALWVSSLGSALTGMTIYNSIRMHTQKALGQPINPHLFRDAAATTHAIADPAHVRLAAPLLGHRTLATTERHYQQAQSFDAHRAYVSAVFGRAKRP